MLLMKARNRHLAIELSTLKPGKLSLEIFNQIARLTVTPVLEIVPLFVDSNGRIKVFLLHRGSDDQNWENMYHVPGTIILASDTPGSYNDALSRIIKANLVQYEPSKPVFVTNKLCKVSRGMETAHIYLVQLSKKPEENSLFDQGELPNNLIEGHRDFINLALDEYIHRLR